MYNGKENGNYQGLYRDYMVIMDKKLGELRVWGLVCRG